MFLGVQRTMQTLNLLRIPLVPTQATLTMPTGLQRPGASSPHQKTKSRSGVRLIFSLDYSNRSHLQTTLVWQMEVGFFVRARTRPVDTASRIGIHEESWCLPPFAIFRRLERHGNGDRHPLHRAAAIDNILDFQSSRR